MDKKQKTAYAIIVILIFGISGYFAVKTWTLGNTEDDYEIVCIQGHEYWRANFLNKGFLAIKMDDNGDPIKCKE